MFTPPDHPVQAEDFPKYLIFGFVDAVLFQLATFSGVSIVNHHSESINGRGPVPKFG